MFSIYFLVHFACRRGLLWAINDALNCLSRFLFTTRVPFFELPTYLHFKQKCALKDHKATWLGQHSRYLPSYGLSMAIIYLVISYKTHIFYLLFMQSMYNYTYLMLINFIGGCYILFVCWKNTTNIELYMGSIMNVVGVFWFRVYNKVVPLLGAHM